jgi:hypothetical protein
LSGHLDPTKSDIDCGFGVTISTVVAQEVIDYVKEHSPELFVNKLAELHM